LPAPKKARIDLQKMDGITPNGGLQGKIKNPVTFTVAGFWLKQDQIAD